MKRSPHSRRAGRSTASSTKSRLLDPLLHVYLAGLGAVSKARAEGPELLNELIKEGARVQARERNVATKAVRSTVGGVRALVLRVVNELPPLRVLEEIRELRKQVSAMDAKIETLVRIRPGSHKRNSIQARR
jgi:Poly(hydroxyalcanoate) granule associated protein (phasin)